MWDIVDDERRGIHLATPMRPQGSRRRGPAAALLLPDDEGTSSAEKRLASDSTTPGTQPRVFSDRPQLEAFLIILLFSIISLVFGNSSFGKA